MSTSGQTLEDDSTVEWVRPDGSLDSTALRQCVEAIGKRCQNVLDALKKLFGVSKQSGERIIIAHSFSVGLEVGALLRDIPNFQRALQVFQFDPQGAMAVGMLDRYLAPLQMAIDALRVSQGGAAAANAGKGTAK